MVVDIADNFSVTVWSFIKPVLYTGMLYVCIHVLVSHAIVHACRGVQVKPKQQILYSLRTIPQNPYFNLYLDNLKSVTFQGCGIFWISGILRRMILILIVVCLKIVSAPYIDRVFYCFTGIHSLIFRDTP
jgi:hypothetical protein